MSQWIYCPICSNKTRLKIREDTELKNFPLFSLKCKQETLIDVKQLLALYIGVRHSNNLVAVGCGQFLDLMSKDVRRKK